MASNWDSWLMYGASLCIIVCIGWSMLKKMNRKSSTRISDDAPLVTQEDIDRSRFRVNLQEAPRKQRVNIMLDTGVISFFKNKAGKRGYQTLINETLKRAIHDEEIETVLRRIIREELAHKQ